MNDEQGDVIEETAVAAPCAHPEVQPGDRFCTLCGQSLTFSQNVRAHVEARAVANWLDLKRWVRCQVCGEGYMFRKTVNRSSAPVAGLGRIMVLLSVLGFLVGIGGCVTIIGAPLGAAWIGGSIFWGVLGLVLSMQKKVLQCSNRRCRATVAAS